MDTMERSDGGKGDGDGSEEHTGDGKTGDWVTVLVLADSNNH